MLGRISSKQSWSMPDIRRSAAEPLHILSGGKLKAIEDSARYARETTMNMARKDQRHKRQFDGRFTDSDRGGAGNVMSLDYEGYAKSKPGQTMMRGRIAPGVAHPGAADHRRQRGGFELEWAGRDRSSWDQSFYKTHFARGSNSGDNSNNSLLDVSAGPSVTEVTRIDQVEPFKGGIINTYPLRHQPSNLETHIYNRSQYSNDRAALRGTAQANGRYAYQSQSRVLPQRASRMDGVTFGVSNSDYFKRRPDHRPTLSDIQHRKSSF